MLKWLVIGIGDITTKRVIPALLAEKRSELWGIVTRDPAKAAPYGARVFTDLDAALGTGGADAVYVASPVFLHAPQTLASLAAGKQVLCEKPVAMNYAEGRTMVEAARAAGKTLGIAYYRRTYPKVARAKELLRQEAIGQPLLAYVTCYEWRSGTEVERSWLFNPALAGGGPLFDIGSHRIDVLNFLFGEPQRVAGQLSNAVHAMAVEDCATVLIEYANKVRGIVDVRWNSRVKKDEFRIIGTDGEMDLTPLYGPDLVYPRGREELPTHANLHFPCIENYVAAVLDGAPLLASGESSIWTDWVTEQAVASSARSRPPVSRPSMDRAEA
ncbi:MAG: Gfo/Idh/MocA family oxidoreductase [Terriglobia bacterium]|jgi:predicted dehydrogenase